MTGAARPAGPPAAVVSVDMRFRGFSSIRLPTPVESVWFRGADQAPHTRSTCGPRQGPPTAGAPLPQSFRNFIVTKRGTRSSHPPGASEGPAVDLSGRPAVDRSGPARRHRPRRPTEAAWTPVPAASGLPLRWAGKDSNLRRQNRQIYSLLPLATRAPTRRAEGYRLVRRYCFGMPTFDVVSEVDMQEVRNAVDQANREAGHPFRLQGNRLVDRVLGEGTAAALLDRGPAPRPVPGPAGEAGQARGLPQVLRRREDRRGGQGSARQKLAIQAGISSDHAKKINKFIKDLGLKGVAPRPRATSCG